MVHTIEKRRQNYRVITVCDDLKMSFNTLLHPSLKDDKLTFIFFHGWKGEKVIYIFLLFDCNTFVFA